MKTLRPPVAAPVRRKIVPPPPESLETRAAAAVLTCLRRLSSESEASVPECVVEETIGDLRITVRRVAPQDNGPQLTPREIEIARLASKGLANKEVSDVLGISIHTVDTYLRRVYTKLNVGCRAAMATKFAALGLGKLASPALG